MTRFHASLLVFALGGCGGSVASDPSASSEDTGTAVTEDTASPLPDSSVFEEGVVVEASPAETGVISTETGVACTRTGDRIEISAVGNGFDARCWKMGPDTGPPTTEFIGLISSTDVSSFVVDRCHPAADCVPMFVTVTAKAPGLDLRGLKKGSFVKVTTSHKTFFGCTSRITVASVASWGGLKNPVDTEKTYLVASDGETGSAYPFNVDRINIGCIKGPGCGGGIDVGYYQLRFTAIGGGMPVQLGMGETGSFWAGGQTFTGRNLRAFYDGACDAYWDFAWWATSF
jgi:hypothetical protein